MDNIDKIEIERKVYEASKDSEYHKRQEERTERAKQRGIEMKKRIENYKRSENLYK